MSSSFQAPIPSRVIPPCSLLRSQGQLPSLPGVKAVDSFRALEVEYQGQPALIASVDGEVFLKMKVIRFTRGNPQAILRQFAAGQAILVTESFSLRHNVKAGDRIKLNTPQGEKEFLHFRRLLRLFLGLGDGLIGEETLSIPVEGRDDP